MKWQRASDGFLERFADATSHWSPDSLSELLGSVMPVVVLGQDRTDAERRGIYANGGSFSPAAGNAATVRLQAISGDVELIELLVYRTAGPIEADYDLTFLPVDPAVLGTQPQGSNGAVIASASPGAGVGMNVAAGNSVLRHPCAGIVVPQGSQIGLRTVATGVSFNYSATWRNLG